MTDKFTKAVFAFALLQSFPFNPAKGQPVSDSPVQSHEVGTGNTGGFVAQKFRKVNIFGTDDRIAEPTASKPNETYLPIGVLMNSTGIPNRRGEIWNETQATAFLASPCYIFSNYHAVYGIDKRARYVDKEYSLTFPLDGVRRDSIPVQAPWSQGTTSESREQVTG